MSDIDKAIAAFIKIRDDIIAREAVFRESIKDLKDKQDQIKAYVHKKLDELGVDNIKSAVAGTAFKSSVDAVSVEDKSAFKQFVLNQIDEVGADGLEFLSTTASKTVVKQYMAENNGALPPGVKYTTFVDVKFRKPTGKIKK